MRKLVIGLVIGLGAVAVVSWAQSTQPAPAVRDVNSHSFYTFLSALSDNMAEVASAVSGTGINVSQIGGVTPATDYTQDAALTIASTAGPAMIVRASAALPTAASADDDAVLLAATRKGALHVADVDPCASPSVNKAAVAIAATADAQLVAVSGSTVVYVCGWNFVITGTTPSYRFWSGTGSVCATSQDNLTGVVLPTAGTLQHAGNGGATVLKANAGEALCFDIGGTTPDAQGVLTYVQQ